MCNKIIRIIKNVHKSYKESNDQIITFLIKTILYIKNNLPRFIFHIQTNTTYKKWVIENSKDINSKTFEFNYNPLISIVVPTYKTPIHFLDKLILSVLDQNYTNWEICISDDNSNDKELYNRFKYWTQKDSRINYTINSVNEHISGNSNNAIKLASGEYVALLDHDDELNKNSLIEVIKVLNDNPSLDFIYSDEDKINNIGIRTEPNFKPKYSESAFITRNYICHFTLIRKSIVEKINGFRKGYEGSQDYDVFLRALQQTNKISHIPKVLYHWRIHENSVSLNSDIKGYAYKAGLNALKDHVKSRKWEAKVSLLKNYVGYYYIEYDRKTILNDNIIVIIHNALNKKHTAQTMKSFKETLNPCSNVTFLINKNSETDNHRIKKCIFSTGFDNSYVIVVRSGVLIKKNNLLNELSRLKQRDDVNVIGGKVLYKNGRIKDMGSYLDKDSKLKNVFANKKSTTHMDAIVPNIYPFVSFNFYTTNIDTIRKHYDNNYENMLIEICKYGLNQKLENLTVPSITLREITKIKSNLNSSVNIKLSSIDRSWNSNIAKVNLDY